MTEREQLRYKDFGDDYDIKDPFKKFAQRVAGSTDKNILDMGLRVIPESRGESALVIDVGPFYIASTPEGLGTKNLVADQLAIANVLGVEKGPSYYYEIGKDTVASIVNDLLTVGTRPVFVGPHWAVGANEWFADTKRYEDLVAGWADACTEAGAVYGSGETPTLRELVNPDSIELSGAGWGLIDPKKRLILGEKLQAGDHIVVIESSGIHANGVSMARGLIENLPDKYATRLPSGRTVGEVLLTPAHIYAKLQESLFQKGIDIHYMSVLTGHAAAKIMRAKQDLTYRIHTLPPLPEEFQFLKDVGNLTSKVLYETFNCGMGYVYFTPEQEVLKVQESAWMAGRLKSWDIGTVEEAEVGHKQVIVEPLDLIYGREALDLR